MGLGLESYLAFASDRWICNLGNILHHLARTQESRHIDEFFCGVDGSRTVLAWIRRRVIHRLVHALIAVSHL